MTPEQLMYFVVGYLTKDNEEEGLTPSERITLLNIVRETIKNADEYKDFIHNETSKSGTFPVNCTCITGTCALHYKTPEVIFGVKCTCNDVTNISCPLHPGFTPV